VLSRGAVVADRSGSTQEGKASTRNDRPRSAVPAPLTLVMHLAKAIFEPPTLLTIRRRVGQTIADLVFQVSQVLAMLPALPIVVPFPVLWAHPGHPRYRDLRVRLPRRPRLSIDCLGESDQGQQRSRRNKPELHFVYSQGDTDSAKSSSTSVNAWLSGGFRSGGSATVSAFCRCRCRRPHWLGNPPPGGSAALTRS